MSGVIIRGLRALGRTIIGTEPPPKGHYSVYLRAHHGDKWTAQGTLPIGEPYQYISGDVAVFIDFNDEDEVPDLEARVERLSRVLDEIADGTTPDRIGRYEYLRDWAHKTAMAGLARETDDAT